MHFGVLIFINNMEIVLDTCLLYEDGKRSEVPGFLYDVFKNSLSGNECVITPFTLFELLELYNFDSKRVNDIVEKWNITFLNTEIIKFRTIAEFVDILSVVKNELLNVLHDILSPFYVLSSYCTDAEKGLFDFDNAFSGAANAVFDDSKKLTAFIKGGFVAVFDSLWGIGDVNKTLGIIANIDLNCPFINYKNGGLYIRFFQDHIQSLCKKRNSTSATSLKLSYGLFDFLNNFALNNANRVLATADKELSSFVYRHGNELSKLYLKSLWA